LFDSVRIKIRTTNIIHALGFSLIESKISMNNASVSVSIPSKLESTDHLKQIAPLTSRLQSHQEIFNWLQGDVQHFVPHQILVSAWGDFNRGDIEQDYFSSMDGVRSGSVNPNALVPMLTRCYVRWFESGGNAYCLSAGIQGFLLNSSLPDCDLSRALGTMHSVLVHAVHERRHGGICLYLLFSNSAYMDMSDFRALDTVLTYLDSALRQIPTLSQTGKQVPQANDSDIKNSTHCAKLTQIEMEILEWIALGKTNPEIGSILDTTLFTIKNHIQRIFRKLNVSNRAQAVAVAAAALAT
jgi:transcriptional regulator EpsA